jgi:hypothetical protein
MHAQAVVWLAALLAASVTTQRESYFWWHASIDAAHSVAAAELPTFVVYGDQPGLDIAWTFKNDEGAESIRIDPSAFRATVVIRARQHAQAIETVLEWSPGGRMIGSEGGELAGALGPQQLAPGDLIQWNSILRRADGEPWGRGEYELRIDMSGPVASLLSSGKPYTGRAQLDGTMLVRIESDSSPHGRKARYIRDGQRAMANGATAAAIKNYRSALAVDPSDRASQASLGQALVAAGEYREAVDHLERALTLAFTGEKSAIPETLAYAYLATGDESNAVRVLRLFHPEPAVNARLERLRKALPGRR